MTSSRRARSSPTTFGPRRSSSVTRSLLRSVSTSGSNARTPYRPRRSRSAVGSTFSVATRLRPTAQSLVSQTEGATSGDEIWHDRRPRKCVTIRTYAEGLATRTAFALPQQILGEHLDDFVLVSDDELYRAMRLHLVEGHQVAEGAGAAATAAAWKLRDDLRGKKIALWISGGNATAESLTR